ncbi:MAG: hypothetical protein KAS12_05210 [Candidatus Aenigmarchaeota archaeon]|nr:hypothetical protein [Candidatus Aenigmarchaeota archaeon]
MNYCLVTYNNITHPQTYEINHRGTLNIDLKNFESFNTSLKTANNIKIESPEGVYVELLKDNHQKEKNHRKKLSISKELLILYIINNLKINKETLKTYLYEKYNEETIAYTLNVLESNRGLVANNDDYLILTNNAKKLLIQSQKVYNHLLTDCKKNKLSIWIPTLNTMTSNYRNIKIYPHKQNT